MSRLLLVVDDEPEVLTAVSEALEEHGYSTVTARNGREALTLISRGITPHAIVLDLAMPVMDGETFLEHRQEEAELAKIPVVVLTAGGLGKVLKLERVETVLHKPVRLDVLNNALDRVTERRHDTIDPVTERRKVPRDDT